MSGLNTGGAQYSREKRVFCVGLPPFKSQISNEDFFIIIFIDAAGFHWL